LHRPDQPSPSDRGVHLGQRRRQHRGNLIGVILGNGGAQLFQRGAEQPRQRQLHRHVLGGQSGRRIQQRHHLGVGPCIQHQRGHPRLLVQPRLGQFDL
jgi:hypothetical protein